MPGPGNRRPDGRQVPAARAARAREPHPQGRYSWLTQPAHLLGIGITGTRCTPAVVSGRSHGISMTLPAGKDSAVIDVGGGTSLLAQRLTCAGFTDVSVVDVSAAALTAACHRPGSSSVRWVNADLLDWRRPRAYQIWHDRAVFHFLVSPVDRAAYLATLRAALPGSGAIILVTFAADGPGAAPGCRSPARSGRADHGVRQHHHRHRPPRRAAPHPGRGREALHVAHRPPILTFRLTSPAGRDPGADGVSRTRSG
jgi:hypothetical protein